MDNDYIRDEDVNGDERSKPLPIPPPSGIAPPAPVTARPPVPIPPVSLAGPTAAPPRTTPIIGAPSLSAGEGETAPVLPVPITSTPPRIAPPSAPSPQHEGFLESLYNRKVAAPQPGQPDTRIKNPFLRDVAGLGLVLARTAEGIATPLAPELAFVPGTQANAMARNRQDNAARVATAEQAEREARAYSERAQGWKALHPESKFENAAPIFSMKDNEPTQVGELQVDQGGNQRPIMFGSPNAPLPPNVIFGAPRRIPEKTLTTDEQTFRDLTTGNNGQPRINPATGQPYTALEAEQAIKRAGQKTNFTSPFEAYAYGTPEQRKAAQDFIAFEKKQGARYERPGDIEQRYFLYKRDPEAYKAMFGDRGAAQDSRDQAQATRMLNYFSKQRKAIQDDFTLDDAEKRQQLAEIDALEKPYLDIAQPGQPSQTGGRSNAGARKAPQYKTGDEVTYKGQRMKVLRVRPDGKLELQPMTAGAE